MTFEHWCISNQIRKPSNDVNLLRQAFEAGRVQGVEQSSATLRDTFAGQALQGILAGRPADTVPHDDLAYFAYKYADDMLHEREAK